MSETTDYYYIKRRRKLLAQFDRWFRRVRTRLEKCWGPVWAAAIVAEARAEFEQLIPRLPYIGGRRNSFTPVVALNGWITGLYRAMTARGASADEVARLCCLVADDYFASKPRWLLRLIGRLAFGWFVRRHLRKQAARSQQRAYPADFVFEYVRNGTGANGEPFDWALKFEECAVQKFYDVEGLDELRPYCNFFDVTYSRYLGVGVDASHTIGLGCDHCELCYKAGRETQVPPLLARVMPPGPDARSG